jgi:hypothetical protein
MNLGCNNRKSAITQRKTSWTETDAVLGADHDFSLTRAGGGVKLVHP